MAGFSLRARNPCSVEGENCSYPNHCSSNTPCTCDNHVWMCGAVDCPDAQPLSPCPVDVPSGPCTDANLQCWYGDDPRPYCRVQATCQQGLWMVAMPKCAGPSDVCPADPNNPPDGVCSTGAAMFCIYGEGYACDCEWYGGPPPTDGGFAEQWACFGPPGGGCPALAPNAGQACSMPSGQQCLYGPTCSSMYMACQNGYWILAGQTACDYAE